jgi:ketosteroid isomerase-like protein
MRDYAAVLFANDAYYNAFLKNDLEAMQDQWAVGSIVGCIHPGRGHILGRENVMKSWDGILTNPSEPNFSIKGATASVHKDMAVVVCYEVFDTVTLVATNVFVREQDEWRIMHHHASASPPPILDETETLISIQ